MFGSVVNRLGSSVRRALSQYAVGSQEPELAFDFIDNEYRTNNSGSTFASAITHSRLGNAVMTDGYGPELVTNGGFDSDSGWLLSNMDIEDGVLEFDTSQSTGTATQILSMETGKTYVLRFYVANRTEGNLYPRLGSFSNLDTLTSDANGWHEYIVNFDGTSNQIQLVTNVSFNGYIDNVSVRAMPVLKWAPHNLVEDSDDLTGLGSITGVTRTTTVLTEDTSTDSHTINIGYPATVGEKYTVACEVKLESGTRFVAFRGFGQGGGGKYPIFNLVNGTIEDSGTVFTDASITDVGDGYYLLKASVVADAAFAGAIHMQISTTSGSGGYIYTGDGTSAIAIRKIRQYRSDLGGMTDNPDNSGNDADFVPTTGAIRYFPRVGHHVYNGNAWVNEGLLAESEARTNLLNPSDFSTSWATTNATQTDNDAVGPDGLSSAIKLEGDANVAAHNIKRGAVNIDASSNYTFSVFAKKGTHDAIGLRMDKNDSGTAWGTFDLTNGYAKASGVGTGADSATIQDIGNGWFRCSITDSTNSSDTTVNPHIHLVDDYASPTSSYDASGDDIYLYGAQLEEGYTPSSYIPTIGSSVTRAEENFTIPSANLPWPEPNYIGSELVTNGTFDSDLSGWTAGSSWSWVSGKAYDGDTQAGPNAELKQSISVTSGKIYAISFDVSGLSGGTPTASWGGSSLVQITADGSYTEYVVATGNSHTLQFSGQNAIYYVDNVSVREINPLSVSIAMDGRITYADTGNTETTFFDWRNTGGSTSYIQINLRTQSTATGEVYPIQRGGGVADDADGRYSQYNPGVLVPFNIASRHGSTFINASIDGVAITADTSPTVMPDLEPSNLDLAHDKYMGTIGTFRVWDKDLGDDGIVEATNPSLEPSLSLTFEGTGTNSFVVNNWSE